MADIEGGKFAYTSNLVIGGGENWACFELANAHRVDMVLLAGDLFHDNKPSRRALQRCMEIMREHSMPSNRVNAVRHTGACT